MMDGIPAPRLIGGIVRSGEWEYHRIPAIFSQDHFLVKPGEMADAMGLPGDGDTSLPVRDASTALGWNVAFSTKHMADLADPRAFMWVYGE